MLILYSVNIKWCFTTQSAALIYSANSYTLVVQCYYPEQMDYLCEPSGAEVFTFSYCGTLNKNMRQMNTNIRKSKEWNHIPVPGSWADRSPLHDAASQGRLLALRSLILQVKWIKNITFVNTVVAVTVSGYVRLVYSCNQLDRDALDEA